MPMPKAAGKDFGGEMLFFASTASVELPSPSRGFFKGSIFQRHVANGGAPPLWPPASPIADSNPIEGIQL